MGNEIGIVKFLKAKSAKKFSQNLYAYSVYNLISVFLYIQIGLA